MSDFPVLLKDTLFRVARKTIEEWLYRRQKLHLTDFEPVDSELMNKRASFVTLTIHDKLRGCVGSIYPFQPLIIDVSQNAFHAAFDDTRFLPLAQEEWPNTEIEISLLTVPTEIQVKDWRELWERIRPGMDGMIIRQGAYQATFLPQVWESLPDKRDFMEALCQKAGLPRLAYQTTTSSMRFYLYQVEILKETKPPSLQ